MRREMTGVLALVLFASSASAEDERQRRAREELDAQVHALVGQQPTRVRVDFKGLEEPGYVLEEAAFEFDGRQVASGNLSELGRDGMHQVWSGETRPGSHTLKARLTYVNGASVVVSDEGGFKWKIDGSVTFAIDPGLEVRVKVIPQRDGSQTDVAKRFRVSLPAEPVMVAKLDDGKLPERLTATAVAAVEPQQVAEVSESEAKPRKTRRESAAVSPSDSMIDLTAESATPKRRKSRGGELAMADQGLQQNARAGSSPEPIAPRDESKGTGSAVAPTPEATESPVAAAESIDAGSPEPVAVAPPPPPPVRSQPTPVAPVEPPRESRSPWILFGVGLVALLAVVMLVTKRK